MQLNSDVPNAIYLASQPSIRPVVTCWSWAIKIGSDLIHSESTETSFINALEFSCVVLIWMLSYLQCLKQKYNIIQYVNITYWLLAMMLKMDNIQIDNVKPFWETPKKSLSFTVFSWFLSLAFVYHVWYFLFFFGRQKSWMAQNYVRLFY